jgi:hypothetical protein
VLADVTALSSPGSRLILRQRPAMTLAEHGWPPGALEAPKLLYHLRSAPAPAR